MSVSAIASPTIAVSLKELSGITLTTIQTPVLPKVGNLMVIENRHYVVRHVLHVQGTRVADVYLQPYVPSSGRAQHMGGFS